MAMNVSCNQSSIVCRQVERSHSTMFCITIFSVHRCNESKLTLGLFATVKFARIYCLYKSYYTKRATLNCRYDRKYLFLCFQKFSMIDLFGLKVICPYSYVSVTGNFWLGFASLHYREITQTYSIKNVHME